MTEKASIGSFFARIWRSVVDFILEVKAEMMKVAWPSRQEIVASTWVVIFAVAIVSAWIFVADRASSILMTALRSALS
ncbi:MAG: preprotein translocase subunit SecE [Candidatus Fermentibacter sp.]|nr:preprotein translocase subunit SecE [Candidatus Fermentibacter sp.]